MQQTPSHPVWAYLSSEPAGPREIRAAWITVFVSAAIFLTAVSFARVPLAQFPVFIPIYVTTLVISDLITAVLLFGQYRALMLPSLLVLAGGYFFTATATFAYALIFPGLFAPTGLLASGPQTSSAMYMFWHTGFPLVIMAYAMFKPAQTEMPVLEEINHRKARLHIAGTIAAVLLAVASFTAFATQGHDLLPVFLEVNRTTVTGKVFLVGIWLLGFLALVLLWRRKPHAVLDVWLYVVLAAWLFDIALSAVLNTGRYDLGWYVGRIYGVLAAAYLLVVLLSENARHYDRLVQSAYDLRVANGSLLQMSLQDGLTGLANRRAFDRYLAEQMAVAQRHRRPLTLAVVDVDHYKAYNDLYGHQAGDDCLKVIASALQSCCQRPGDLAARHGGEEFSLIMPDTDRAGAAHVANAALAAVAKLRIPHARSTTGAHVSVSVGVAILPADCSPPLEPAQLIAQADRALYCAKANGRNQAVVYDDKDMISATAAMFGCGATMATGPTVTTGPAPLSPVGTATA
jgi:diguanylate cyclase (GGDEF)-like protein